jgi:hypothetical protein
LAKQEELWDYRGGLEDFGEDPKDLDVLEEGCVGEGEGEPYALKGVLADDPFFKYEKPEWCDDDATAETVEAELPGLFTFASAGVDGGH